MIIDFRYHVVTLVAVFLALGLGILIGANLGKTVNLQFEKQIDRLELTYEKIRDDQKLLQASLQVKENQLEIANQFQNAIIPNLISNRLVGKKVALIMTNDSMDFKYAKSLADILRQAGAIVASISSIKSFDIAEPQLKTELVDAFDLPMKNEKDLLPEIDKRILEIIAAGRGALQLQYLLNKDLLQLRQGDYNQGPIDTFIFFGGAMTPESNHQKELDLPLLEAARKMNDITLIGVEPSFVNESYMRIYQLKCQITVDNIETAPGKVSLVYLMLSGKKGHYGIKDTAAQGLVPAMKLNY